MEWAGWWGGAYANTACMREEYVDDVVASYSFVALVVEVGEICQ